MNGLPRPTCARCHKPVERVEMDRDILRAVTIVTALCHGEIETVEIPDAEVARGIRSDGVAFAGKPALPALPAPDMHRRGT